MLKKFPAQSQLEIPLLDVLERSGGRVTARDAADALARRFNLDPKIRQAKTNAGAAGMVNGWDRHVRWTRQRLALQGLVGSPGTGVWEITPRGKESLDNIRPGLVIRIFETHQGVALWGEMESALAHIEDGIVNLVMTSPPYPLIRKKEYGNLDAKSYVDWMYDVARGLFDKLADDGSFVLNLGDCWQPGSRTQSLYQERLLLRLVDDAGFHLAQRFHWENPSKMPGPAQYVTIERVRVTPSVETVWHLSKTESPKANNRHVLRPYSDSMKRLLARGGESAQSRPSGYQLAEGAFAQDNGGAIPHNLLVYANTRSQDAYARECKARGIKQHPARFPAELPEFFIRYLTDEGDVVFDPFGGSGQTALVAESLGRRWIQSEKSLEYLRGNELRFEDRAGFQSFVGDFARV